MKKKKAIQCFPVRTCHTVHECYICNKDIKDGEKYFDGGYGHRAHVICVAVYRGIWWKEDGGVEC